MTPTSWASMRSMARCVLPVLVGPSTAVTPRPRCGLVEIGEKFRLILTISARRFDQVRNVGGTNLVRIADSAHSDFVPRVVATIFRSTGSGWAGGRRSDSDHHILDFCVWPSLAAREGKGNGARTNQGRVNLRHLFPTTSCD